MIRLVIIVVFLFLLWMLFISGFERRRKIIASITALIICGLALWFDGYDKRQYSSLIDTSQVESCGVTGQHSYRTNFDLNICVSNNAERGTLSRIEMAVLASRCKQGKCEILEQVKRDIPVRIPAKSTATIEQNLTFDMVPSDTKDIQWSIEVLATKATR